MTDGDCFVLFCLENIVVPSTSTSTGKAFVTQQCHLSSVPNDHASNNAKNRKGGEAVDCLRFVYFYTLCIFILLFLAMMSFSHVDGRAWLSHYKLH